MSPRPRCLECVWCALDPYLDPVCEIYDRPLSKRDMWRRACAAFEEIDPACALDGPGSGPPASPA